MELRSIQPCLITIGLLMHTYNTCKYIYIYIYIMRNIFSYNIWMCIQFSAKKACYKILKCRKLNDVITFYNFGCSIVCQHLLKFLELRMHKCTIYFHLLFSPIIQQYTYLRYLDPPWRCRKQKFAIRLKTREVAVVC